MQERFALGLDEALALALDQIRPLDAKRVDLTEAVDCVAAQDLLARVDSPSIDASLRDGYAVFSRDLIGAGPTHPVRLTLSGFVAAGEARDAAVVPGTTVRILTGAKVPDGADAVVAEEDTSLMSQEVVFTGPAKAGAYVLAKGAELAAGHRVSQVGDLLSPGRVGLLAAAGYRYIPVIRPPAVAIAAIGDEVVSPGQPLAEGKLYASNMATLSAWCRRYGMPVHTVMARDDSQAIADTLHTHVKQTDALITSGGAWTGDRDLVSDALQRLGWRPVFRTLRMSPGKGVGFGWLQDKPVFVLPGGPPANMIGFLQIALPALLKLSGRKQVGLPRALTRLSSDLTGQEGEWTQFVFGRLEVDGGDYPLFDPMPRKQRLVAMADATALAAIPEGCTIIPAGSLISVQLLE